MWIYANMNMYKHWSICIFKYIQYQAAMTFLFRQNGGAAAVLPPNVQEEFMKHKYMSSTAKQEVFVIFVCIYSRICVFIYINMYVHIFTTCLYVYIERTFINMHWSFIHIYIYICIYLSIYVQIYAWIYICMYVHICIYIYIYKYTYKLINI